MQNKTPETFNQTMPPQMPSDISGYVKGIKGKILESEFKSLRQLGMLNYLKRDNRLDT